MRSTFWENTGPFPLGKQPWKISAMPQTHMFSLIHFCSNTASDNMVRCERNVHQMKGSKTARFPQFILWISRQKQKHTGKRQVIDAGQLSPCVVFWGNLSGTLIIFGTYLCWHQHMVCCQFQSNPNGFVDFWRQYTFRQEIAVGGSFGKHHPQKLTRK